MSLIRGCAFAIIGSALGAVGWAFLAHAADSRLGLTASLVGMLAGYGMSIGCNSRGGLKAGTTATVIAVLAIFASRFGALSMDARQTAQRPTPITEMEAIEALAKDPSLSPGGSSDFSQSAASVHSVSMARQNWIELSNLERETVIRRIQQRRLTQNEAVTLPQRFDAFGQDFLSFGFVWVALGAIVAFRIGGRHGEHTFAPGLPTAGALGPTQAELLTGGPLDALMRHAPAKPKSDPLPASKPAASTAKSPREAA